MHHTGGVDGLQRLDEALGDRRDHRTGERGTTHHRLERLALHEVHHEMRHRALGLDRAHAGDTFAPDAPERLGLVAEPTTHVRGRGDLRVQDLDRDPLTVRRLRQQHHPGRSRTEPPDDPVATDLPRVTLTQLADHHGSGYRRRQSAAASRFTASRSADMAFDSSRSASSIALCSRG